MTRSLSFGEYFTGPTPISLTGPAGALLLLVIVALFIVLLTENSRVPVDDPATHLELTMIHEVMVLDHSGPDLALIELGSFYKLFFYAAFLTMIVCPLSPSGGLLNLLVFYGVLVLVYMAIGLVESVMARFKMNLVPKFVLTSSILVVFAAILTMGFIQ
jgi:formate hydrogenlyase subunit 4